MSKQSYQHEIMKLWDQWTGVHLDSSFYDLKHFLHHRSSLTPIESGELGHIKGKTILHLQCHFGMDSLSLANRGARVTGVDISERAIREARHLAETLSLDVNFICTDLYDLERHLDQEFDMVFSSYGVIKWLPDLKGWATLIQRYLKPGGIFYLAEFHPLLFIIGEQFERIIYPWESGDQPLVFMNSSSYAEPDRPLKNTEYNWHHGTGSVLGALLERGLQLRFYHEHHYSPYRIHPEMIEEKRGQWVLPGWMDRQPYVYSLLAENV